MTTIDDMALSGKERAQRFRDRKKAGEQAYLGRPVEKGCGTAAGAKRHRRAGQDVCDPCAEAERKYNREKQADHRAKSAD